MTFEYTFIPGPLCRTCKIAKSQEELDNIPTSFNGYIMIEFGDNINGYAEITKTYKNAIIRVCRDSKVYIKAYNIVEAFDNSYVHASYKTIVYAYGDSCITAIDSTTIFAYGNSQIDAYCKSHVYAYWNSIVKAYDESIIESHDNSETYLYNKCSIVSYKGTTIHICDGTVNVTRDNFKE